MRATPRWQVVENVVAAIERVRSNLPGLVVTQRAQLPRLTDPNDVRDVDVLVELPVGGRKLTIAVEVKNKRRPLSIDQMGCIVDLRRDISADRFCVVSTSGFSPAARRKARENSIEFVELEEFERNEFWAYPPQRTIVRNGGQFVHVQFDFSEEVLVVHRDALQAAFTNTAHDDVTLLDDTGSTSVTMFLNEMWRQQLHEQVRSLDHGEEFVFAVDMRQRADLRIAARGQKFPGPEFITATLKISRIIEHVVERRFRLGSIEVATAEMDLFGKTEQISLAKVPRPDGSTDIMISRGDIVPKRSRKHD